MPNKHLTSSAWAIKSDRRNEDPPEALCAFVWVLNETSFSRTLGSLSGPLPGGRWGQVEHDTVMLTEYVRAALKRYISHKYTRGQNTLIVYLLDPQIEETVRSSIQHTSSGSYLALEPEITQEILSAVRTEVGSLPPTAQNPVILTTMEIRRYFRKLVELEFPHLAVLSYQELSPDMNIQPIARISLE